MSEQESMFKEPECLHCPHNPNAVKPYKKMKVIRDKETIKAAEFAR